MAPQNVSGALIKQDAILAPFFGILRVAKVAKVRATTEDRSITACRHAARRSDDAACKRRYPLMPDRASTIGPPYSSFGRAAEGRSGCGLKPLRD